jgi:hypothetical protein
MPVWTWPKLCLTSYDFPSHTFTPLVNAEHPLLRLWPGENYHQIALLQNLNIFRTLYNKILNHFYASSEAWIVNELILRLWAKRANEYIRDGKCSMESVCLNLAVKIHLLPLILKRKSLFIERNPHLIFYYMVRLWLLCSSISIISLSWFYVNAREKETVKHIPWP